jgi:hypothetical protein
MKKTILLIALVVLVSGCTGTQLGVDDKETPTEVSYPGVSITSFYPIVSPVNPGDPITFYSAAQNNGNFDATNLKFILFNCGAATPLAGSDFSCNSEFIPNGIDRLERPNRDKGIPGDIVEKELILIAPTNLPKATTGQDFGLRVMYDYSTRGTQEALLSSYDNWLQKGGQITGYVLNSYSSPAPISLEIVAPKTPIILQPNTVQTVSVAVNVKNSGGGSLENNSFREIRLKFDPEVLEPLRLSDSSLDPSYDFDSMDGADTLLVTDSDKLKIIGSTKQWRSYDIMFTVKSTHSCVGTPTTVCSDYSENSCTEESGCTFGNVCMDAVNPIECSTLGCNDPSAIPSNCACLDAFCTWNTNSNSCSESNPPLTCSAYNGDQDICDSAYNCDFKNNWCSGGRTLMCSDYTSESSCTEESGCTWDSTASNIIQDAIAFEASVEYTYMIDANARVSYAPSR